MIVVDTSVMVDAFRGVSNRQADRFMGQLGRVRMLLGDLMICEIPARPKQ